jgi:hypothetical protein
MQCLERPREKLPAQKQWQAMKKQCAEQWKQSEIRTSITSGCEPGGRSSIPECKEQAIYKNGHWSAPLKSHDFLGSFCSDGAAALTHS